MAKRLSIAVAAIFIAFALFLAHRWYDRFPWLEASVRAHAEGGSTNCGHLTNSGYEPHPNPEAVIQCVVSAHQQRRPFFVTVSISGVDEQFNSAIIGDSKGQAIEVFYALGMVESPNTLLRRVTYLVSSSSEMKASTTFRSHIVARGLQLPLSAITSSGEIDVTGDRADESSSVEKAAGFRKNF